MGNSTKELVNAFNLNNYFSDKINANFTVEGKKIVGLFASGTDIGKYLQGIGEGIIKRQYLSRAEVASRYYNLNYFPFVLGANPDKEDLGNGIVKVKLADSTNNEVIRNLKVHFANEFKKAVISKVVARLKKEVKITEEEAHEWIRGTVRTGAIGMPYLYCIAFSNEYLGKRYSPKIFELFKSFYISEFNSRVEECGLKSSDFYKYEDDMLYIKDVSDKVVKSVTEYVKGRVALYLGTPGIEDPKVENFKDVLSSLMFKRLRKYIDTYDYDTFTDEKKIQNGDSLVLIPLIKDDKDDGEFYTLNSRDACRINGVRNNFISDIKGKTAKPQYANAKGSVYAFSNQQIALLLPKIMESPIAYNQINGRFEFAVDLENFKECGSSRSSSTVASPFNSPTHAGPSGLRTPPNQRRSIDSGIGESPPKPKDSGSSSGGPGPLTKLSGMECEPSTHFQNCSVSGLPNGHLDEAQLTQLRSPTGKSQDVVLKESPRQGLEEPFMSHRGTSEEFPPRTYISSATVVSEQSSLLQSVGAAQNVQAGFNLRPQSRPSSWKGANPVGANPWAQQTNPCLSQGTSENKWTSSMQFTKPEPSDLSWSQGGSSLWKGVNIDTSKWTSTLRSYSSLPPLIPSSGGIIPRFRSPTQVSFSESSSSKGASERRTSDKPLTEEEEKLFKKLLYWFNLNNYALDPPHTNFIVKNGKIASLIDDGVDVKEYLQEIIDKTKEEYRVNKKEACDLNEFPFKFLSSCEENQETTVVANISRGALLNLKELFGREHEGKVEIKDIDINIVEKAVKSEKDKWVNFQVQEHGLSPKKAIKTCYPDESVLEYISITKDKGGYWINRDYDGSEVKSFRGERWLAKGTSKAEKMKSEDNKDSGISSGEATDAENISSKAEAITSSGYESMDYENTREGSPKRSGEEVVQTFKKQCIISTQIEDVTSESFGQRQGSIVG